MFPCLAIDASDKGALRDLVLVTTTEELAGDVFTSVGDDGLSDLLDGLDSQVGPGVGAGLRLGWVVNGFGHTAEGTIRSWFGCTSSMVVPGCDALDMSSESVVDYRVGGCSKASCHLLDIVPLLGVWDCGTRVECVGSAVGQHYSDPGLCVSAICCARNRAVSSSSTSSTSSSTSSSASSSVLSYSSGDVGSTSTMSSSVEGLEGTRSSSRSVVVAGVNTVGEDSAHVSVNLMMVLA